MSIAEWRVVWITTLVDSGISRQTAELVYDVCCGNQNIDPSTDPVAAASVFVFPRLAQNVDV